MLRLGGPAQHRGGRGRRRAGAGRAARCCPGPRCGCPGCRARSCRPTPTSSSTPTTAPICCPPAELARAGRAGPRLPGRAGRRGRGAGRGGRAPGGRGLPGWSGPAFAAVTIALLGLRARSFVDPGPARALGGRCAGWPASGWPSVLALVRAGRGPDRLPRSGPAAGGRGARPRRVPDGRWARRSGGAPVDLGEGALTAAVVPLALAATRPTHGPRLVTVPPGPAEVTGRRPGQRGCRRQVEQPARPARTSSAGAGRQQRQHRIRGRLRSP